LRSRPDEIRVLGLEPIAAWSALVEAALSLRDDAFEAELAGLLKYHRTLGGQSFAEQDPVDAVDELHQRLSSRFERTQAQIDALNTQKVEGDERGLRPAALGQERMEVAAPVVAEYDRFAGSAPCLR
jgi:hypothetical protein